MKPEYKIGDKIKISNSKISKRFNKKTGTIIKINDDDYMAKIKLDTLVKTNVKIYTTIFVLFNEIKLIQNGLEKALQRIIRK